MVKASAPTAGPDCRSSPHPIARGSAFPLFTIPGLTCSRWKRSPIRRPMRAPALRYATTTWRVRWCMRSNTRTALILRRQWAAGWHGREANFSMRPTCSSRCRCTGGALARVIERQSGVKLVPDALNRIRPTQQQIGLSRPQRASNVQGAFKVASAGQALIAGRRVILIDDVLTSGATVDACARALLRAKAAAVDVLVFARVVDGHKAPI